MARYQENKPVARLANKVFKGSCMSGSQPDIAFQQQTKMLFKQQGGFAYFMQSPGIIL